MFWLPAGPRAAAVVRSRMRAFLHLPDSAQAAVAVVVTELVGRAVTHLEATEDGRFEVRLERSPGRARIVVEHGAAPDERFEDAEVEGYRDLLLDGLSLARGRDGSTAWVVVEV